MPPAGRFADDLMVSVCNTRSAFILLEGMQTSFMHMVMSELRFFFVWCTYTVLLP